jgi:hypothetical protein
VIAVVRARTIFFAATIDAAPGRPCRAASAISLRAR